MSTDNAYIQADIVTAAGRTSLNEIITLQSTIIAYMDDFKLLMLMSLAVIPLVLLLRKPKAAPASTTVPSWNSQRNGLLR